jgi:hypothetical protein
MTPFVLTGRSKLAPEPAPSDGEYYDPVLQLWIHRESGEPLVSHFRKDLAASQYGETSLTDTREGADQSESAIHASNYGETTLTKTHEGTDQTEATSWQASQYGETMKTTTREGIDQPERSLDASSYGETTATRTREGADQTEMSSGETSDMSMAQGKIIASTPNTAQLNSLPSSYAPYPHF